MSELFDMNQFLAEPIEAELDTQVIPIPEGEYPNAIVKEYVGRQIQRKDGTGFVRIVDVTWVLPPDARTPEGDLITEVTGRDECSVRQSLFLDVNDAGKLDTAKGKNVALGALRDALGQNTTAAWSFDQAVGQSATVKVVHKLDDTNPDRRYANVSRVAGN